MKNVDLLRPLFASGLLNSDNEHDSVEFKSWVSSGKYLLDSIISQKALTINVNNDYAFINMLAHDASRMASASFESITSIQLDESLPKSFGWMAIKAYYSSFFAAHSILRCFGYVCSQLERGHIQIFQTYATALNMQPTLTLESGFFCGKWDKSTKILSLKKMKNTHEDTWTTFLECLQTLSKDVLLVQGLTTTKQLLSAEIDEIVTLIQNNNKFPRGNFLSSFRNSINYRQEYHAWFPYGKNSIKAEKIHALISQWQKEDFPIINTWKESREVYNFFYACTKIVNMCHSLVIEICKTSSNNNNNFNLWPNKFLKIRNHHVN